MSLPLRPNGECDLSPQEMEVLKWIQQGKDALEIALILEISQSAVRFHISNILEKLNAVNRAHAVAIALEKGMLQE